MSKEEIIQELEAMITRQLYKIEALKQKQKEVYAVQNIELYGSQIAIRQGVATELKELLTKIKTND